MREAESIADFLADPVGRFVAGRSFVTWMQTTRRGGTTHFGVHDAYDEARLTELYVMPEHPALVIPYDVLFDSSALDAFDRSNFALLAGFLEQQVGTLATSARRFAMVKPSGMIGAMFAGVFHEWIEPRLPVASLFADRAEALEWLGLPAGNEERRALDRMFEAVLATPLLRSLRKLIDADLRDATLATAATTLGTSERSLQRHLAEHGTSFRDELIGARIRAAGALLLHGNEKVEAIAHQLGFQSVSAFISVFGRMVGEPPDAFRKRHYQSNIGSTLNLMLLGTGPALALPTGTFHVYGTQSSFQFDTSTWLVTGTCAIDLKLAGGPDSYNFDLVKWGQGQYTSFGVHRTGATRFAGSRYFEGYETVPTSRWDASFSIDPITQEVAFSIQQYYQRSTTAGPAGGIDGEVRYNVKCEATL